LDYFSQRDTLDQLHGDEVEIFRLADVIDGDDVRVFQTSGDHRFPPEPLYERLVPSKIGRKDLEGTGLTKANMDSAEDGAHAATAQQLLNFVRP
jgi:hypothetical protein